MELDSKKEMANQRRLSVALVDSKTLGNSLNRNWCMLLESLKEEPI